MDEMLVDLTSLLTFVMTSASTIKMNMITVINSTISKSLSLANYTSTVMLFVRVREERWNKDSNEWVFLIIQ